MSSADPFSVPRSPTTRRRVLAGAVTLSAGLALTGPSAAGAAPARASRPNIITILADDLGYGDTSLYDGTIATPHLERLAADGVTFTSGYTAAPVCSPSRWGLMTGREPATIGADSNFLVRNDSPVFTDAAGPLPSMATLLSDRGYATLALGKWDLSGVAQTATEETIPGHPNLPDEVGFDDFWGVLAGISHFCPEGPVAPRTYVYDRAADRYRSELPETYLTDDLTRRAVDWVGERQRAAEPFFLFLSYNAPHVPLQTRDICAPVAAGAPESERIARYTAMVTALDDGIGAVLDALDEETRANTIVTFVSDNGPEHEWQTGPLRDRKQTLYEGGIRVPYVVSWPARLPRGVVSDAVVSTLDLLPTHLLAADPDFDAGDRPGRDLTAVVTGTAPTRAQVWRHYNDSAPVGGVPVGTTRLAVRDDRWKWVRDITPTGEQRTSLFDLQTDPGERDDLATTRPDRLAATGQRFRDWSAATTIRLGLTTFRPTGLADGFAVLGGGAWRGDDTGLHGTAGAAGTTVALATGIHHDDARTELTVRADSPDATAGVLVRGELNDAGAVPDGLVVLLDRTSVRLVQLRDGRTTDLAAAAASAPVGADRRVSITVARGRAVVRIDRRIVISHPLPATLPVGGVAGVVVATGSATATDLRITPVG